MKRLSRLGLAALAAGGLLTEEMPASAATIYSAGATLPGWLYYDAWFPQFNGGVRLDAPCNPATTTCVAYALFGSGAGVMALINQQSPGAVVTGSPVPPGFLPGNAFIPFNEANGYGPGSEFFDFAASDVILTTAHFAAYSAASGPQSARGPVIQIPSVGTSVAIPFHIDGAILPRPIPPGIKTATGGSGRLFLSRRAYCGIFTGAVTTWNNAVIARDNPGATLPATAITVVVRNDSSMTTSLLTRHLETVCQGTEPRSGIALSNYNFGVGMIASWPASFVRVTGSDGMVSKVRDINGAIGYVSPDYTAQIGAPWVNPPQVTANLESRADFDGAVAIGNVKPLPPAPTYTQNAIANFSAPVLDTTAPFSNAELWGAALGDSSDPVGNIVNPPNAVAPGDPANPEAYPIAGFTQLDFYSCYFPASETTTIRGFIDQFTGTTTRAAYDAAARHYGFAPLPQATSDAIRAWVLTNAATQIRTGPISGTCTISSGT